MNTESWCIFVIGIFNIDVVKPMSWGGPALSVYIRGGGPLERTLYIPTPSIRLSVFTVLLLAEITSIVGYWWQERSSSSIALDGIMPDTVSV